MSYILKDTTQGIISVKLTDAGRKKLSQGKLNIELFQLGDSEYCYDCNTRLPGLASGIEIQQANFNAQNLNAIPEKNKAHVKYPVPISQTSPNQTFGAAQAAHTYEEIFNRASQRGFYEGNTATTCGFSAFTGSAYTLNANLRFPVSAMTGGSRITLLSAHTFVDQAFSGGTLPGYTPVIGDILGIHYQFYSGSTGTTAVPPCYDAPCTSPSAMLFYQIIGGNSTSGRTGSSWSGSTAKPLFYTVDRELPDVMRFSGAGGGTFIGNYTGTPTAPTYACVKVYPNVTGGTYSANSSNPMLTYFGASTPKPYWSPGSLSFENNCDVSVKDVKVWNMNIPWTEQVAGVDSTNSNFESVDYYGSTGYTGTKEYLGYRSNTGQVDTGTIPDTYDSSITSSSWYYDSYKNKVAVPPSRQKAVAVLHYTNQTISNFYGEKFAMNEDAASKDEFGKAKNFRLCMPWLMWHKKYVNDAVQGCPSGATEYGQCFYTDPPGFNVFPTQPYVMQSSINPNMNDDGLRYYYLWDDNAGPQSNNLGQTKVGPNPVGKVFPDLKMVVIHDEELVAAMSYKSNRSWTLPAPKITKIPAGTNCVGTTSNIGVYNNTAIEENMYITYLLESNSGLTTGLHCNYYTSVKNQAFSEPVDLEINFGNEFPFLKPFDLQASFGLNPLTQGGITGGTGWQANKIHLLYQIANPGEDPKPHLWKRVEVTDQIGGSGSPYITASTSTSYIPLSGCVLSSADTRFFLTKSLMDDGESYTLNDYITVPTATSTSGAKNLTGPQLLQFGDEYFYNGVLETDIMATIYEMRYNINLASSQFGNTPTGNGSSLNPTYQKYFDDNGVYPSNVFVTEVGLFDNKDGNPDLMAIAKFQSPHKRQGAEQFVLKIDF
tara:strand:+ start:34429 stop:37074 length:2646 start_codon:yes stop_codon:yes gene_type:complete